MQKKVKIGLAGVGLNTYWGQFDGLLNSLLGYQSRIKERVLKTSGVEIVDVGMIDSVEKANAAATTLKGGDIEIMFLFVSTYALSSTVLPLVSRLHVPVIMLNLQPTPAIDYEKMDSMSDRKARTGEWLQYCNACSIPEFATVFNRTTIKYDIVTGYLDDPEAWDEINEWIKVAKLTYGMRTNRMGVLGNYYGGMIDVYSDLTYQSTVFGTHIEVLEMCELAALRKSVTPQDIERKLKDFHTIFNVENTCEESELRRAASTSVALDKLVEKHNLGSIAYYYEGAPGNEYEDIITSVIVGNTLLTGKNIPIAGEYEIKTVQAMKIMALLGVGGCFSEFYSIDFNDDIIMLGHDGPSHFLMAKEQVKLVPLTVYHGKPGKGLSIQMDLKKGPVTLLSIVESKEGLSLLVAEGESVEGPIINTGNLNSRYKFPITAKEFIDRWSKAGPPHHCSIGMGHIASLLKKYALILDIPINIIS